MSCWTKEELENKLEDVVNELELSESMIHEHGQLGTDPAELVKLVLEQKDKQIAMLNAGMVNISNPNERIVNPQIVEAGTIAIGIVENVEPKLTEKEQAFFVAGFTECVKYLSNLTG